MVLATGELFFMQLFQRKLLKQLETVVKAFKEANPASNRVQVIVIDKDFTEHKVLTTGFPKATILFFSSMLSNIYIRKCLIAIYPRTIEKSFEEN